MGLKEFIEQFVCKNTLIRLWKPYRDELNKVHGHQLVMTEDGKDVCMEWEITNNKVHKQYANCTVKDVTDILCESYKEAVNIVLDIR